MKEEYSRLCRESKSPSGRREWDVSGWGADEFPIRGSPKKKWFKEEIGVKALVLQRNDPGFIRSSEPGGSDP